MKYRISPLAIIGSICAGILVISACGTSTPALNATDKKVIEGVECIIYNSNNNAGGISCNWEAYNAAKR